MAVVLGLNSFHAGASAALVIDGVPVAAIAEERLNRVKYYAKFPTQAINKCLEMAGIGFREIDYVAVGRDPSSNKAQKIKHVLTHPTLAVNLLKIRAARSQMDDLKTVMARECGANPADLRFEQVNVEHHLAHIASAYYISPWEKCAGFSMDGSGDFVTCMMAECEGDSITVKSRVHIPHSLGMFYTMICQLIGYRKYGDEGKIMGLAPYGKLDHADHFRRMVQLTDTGFRLDPRYFQPFGSNEGVSINDSGEMLISKLYSSYAEQVFGPAKEPYTELVQRDMDLAFGVQNTFERVYLHCLNLLHKAVPTDRVCMAGGAALNSVANGMVFTETPFRETVIQPAAGDEGLALGAALYVSRSKLKDGERFVMKSSYLGQEYSDGEVRAVLDRYGIEYEKVDRPGLLDAVSAEIEKGSVVGWFQGRMEWGPRALGNRSILAHPGRTDMKDILNARIKRREWFRPFAPSVKADRQGELFERSEPSPFMLHVYKIKPEWRERLHAVNHVDNTGRLQTVTEEENPLYYDLIGAFEKRTGIPVVLNTSFNENEPIVCTPEEAVECFSRTKMDVLALGSHVCRKPSAPAR
jgi:carbamoyltransferase